MIVAIEIPDDLEGQLKASWNDLPRRVLEAVAIEAYRSEALAPAEIGRLLGMTSRWDIEEFLRNAGAAALHYAEPDFASDRQALRAARGL
jgi:predicted HTH domain antitoxin